jgi:hypothetical protein
LLQLWKNKSKKKKQIKKMGQQQSVQTQSTPSEVTTTVIPVECCSALQPHQEVMKSVLMLDDNLSAWFSKETCTSTGVETSCEDIVKHYLSGSSVPAPTEYVSVIKSLETSDLMLDLLKVTRTVVIRSRMEFVAHPWPILLQIEKDAPRTSFIPHAKISAVGISYDPTSRVVENRPTYVSVVRESSNSLQLKVQDALSLALSVYLLKKSALLCSNDQLGQNSRDFFTRDEQMLLVYVDTVTSAMICYRLSSADLWLNYTFSRGHGLVSFISRCTKETLTTCTGGETDASKLPEELQGEKPDMMNYLAALED